MQVPAEDTIPVPVDCSEWLATLGYSWWGHQYAARLRDGAEAARRPLKEMKQIVEDRLHRSSSNAFTARLPPTVPTAQGLTWPAACPGTALDVRAPIYSAARALQVHGARASVPRVARTVWPALGPQTRRVMRRGAPSSLWWLSGPQSPPCSSSKSNVR